MKKPPGGEPGGLVVIASIAWREPRGAAGCAFCVIGAGDS